MCRFCADRAMLNPEFVPEFADNLFRIWTWTCDNSRVLLNAFQHRRVYLFRNVICSLDTEQEPWGFPVSISCRGIDFFCSVVCVHVWGILRNVQWQLTIKLSNERVIPKHYEVLRNCLFILYTTSMKFKYMRNTASFSPPFRLYASSPELPNGFRQRWILSSEIWRPWQISVHRFRSNLVFGVHIKYYRANLNLVRIGSV
jgi:hypothetical protein